MRRPLPILRENPNNRHQYDRKDGQGPPRGLDAEHCPLCGWEPCKCQKHTHGKSEE
jgi:hypothetical protein